MLAPPLSTELFISATGEGGGGGKGGGLGGGGEDYVQNVTRKRTKHGA